MPPVVGVLVEPPLGKVGVEPKPEAGGSKELPELLEPALPLTPEVGVPVLPLLLEPELVVEPAPLGAVVVPVPPDVVGEPVLGNLLVVVDPGFTIVVVGVGVGSSTTDVPGPPGPQIPLQVVNIGGQSPL